MSAMLRQAVTVKELAGGAGWLWTEHGRTYQSAATAARAIKRDARRLASAGRAVATLITWEPCTHAGRIAAQAIASS